MGGKKKFVDFIDRHFDGGHNLHTNEPSHHIVSATGRAFCLSLPPRTFYLLPTHTSSMAQHRGA